MSITEKFIVKLILFIQKLNNLTENSIKVIAKINYFLIIIIIQMFNYNCKNW